MGRVRSITRTRTRVRARIRVSGGFSGSTRASICMVKVGRINISFFFVFTVLCCRVSLCFSMFVVRVLWNRSGYIWIGAQRLNTPRWTSGICTTRQSKMLVCDLSILHTFLFLLSFSFFFILSSPLHYSCFIHIPCYFMHFPQDMQIDCRETSRER